MNTIVILTGGNLGDRVHFLQQARKAIESTVGTIIKVSPIVESEAWGFESENEFLNQVLVIETELAAIEILDTIQAIEINLGRIRKEEQWVSRLIDIDILFFNKEIINTNRLTVPHKNIHERRFTLYALNLIMSTFEHPKYHKTINTLLNSCTDKSRVEVYHA